MTTTTTVNQKTIYAFHGLLKLADGIVAPLLNSTVQGLTVNATTFPKLPYDLATYSAGVTAYENAIPAALDGGKIAVAQKNKLRGAAIKMYTQIAHYVEANCNDDMATFLLSGFQAVSNTKTVTPPLSNAIRTAGAGPLSGQVSIRLVKDQGATSNELRWGPTIAGAAPAAWSSQPVVGVRKAVIISGLTPGTVYAFQARALTAAGYSDWSDSVTLMCT